MISVKKISLFLFFFLFSNFAFTAPFVMLEKYEGPLLGKLIQLQPVKVYIADARHNRGNNAYRAGHISSDLCYTPKRLLPRGLKMSFLF